LALEKGAQNVVQCCLAVKPDETLVIIHHGAAKLVACLGRAAAEIGATTQVLSAQQLCDSGESAAGTTLDGALSRGGPVIWLAELGLPSWVPHLVKQRANRLRCRHLHVPQADPRLFEQSIRAHPDQLSVVNMRVAVALTGASRLTVTSAAGTNLEIRLDPRFPLVQLCGRPAPGETHWLPAGQVYTHPSQIAGTFVVDRGLLIAGSARDTSVGRAHPARFEIARGFVQSASSEVAADQAAIDEYLGSAPHARRVASIILPTNYLVRTEIGHRGQDGLLPGLNINLGFADEATRAPYKTRVQMCLYARNLTVRAGNRELVRDGRFTPEVLRGDEAFR
jgi:leucyl aminopeptidase (aminopeptidase T)